MHLKNSINNYFFSSKRQLNTVQLYLEDQDRRKDMCSLLSRNIFEEDDDDGDQFMSSLCFFDEKTYSVSGLVNRDKCVISGEENSRKICEYEQNNLKNYMFGMPFPMTM